MCVSGCVCVFVCEGMLFMGPSSEAVRMCPVQEPIRKDPEMFFLHVFSAEQGTFSFMLVWTSATRNMWGHRMAKEGLMWNIGIPRTSWRLVSLLLYEMIDVASDKC